jgi:hypothetical protein
LHFNIDNGTIVCEGGLENGDAVSLYNMGGVLVSSTVATTGRATLSVAGLPHSSYIIVVNCEKGRRVYKVVI